MSLSVMAPTPRCTTSTRTSLVLSCAGAVGQRFGRATLVRLDDDAERGDFAFLEGAAEVFQ